MRFVAIVSLSFLLAACATEPTPTAPMQEPRGTLNPVKEALGAVPLTLGAQITFQPRGDSGRFGPFTLPTGSYVPFGRDSRGIFYLYAGDGLSIPGNPGLPQKGGIYVPAEENEPAGVWILPTHYSAATGVLYLADLPPADSTALRGWLK